MKRPRSVVLGSFAALMTLVVVAGSLAATTSKTAGPPGYKGVEASLPTQFKRPAKRAGTECTIGFQNPVAANETLSYLQKAAVKQGAAYGCKVITLDDKLSADKQVSNMQQLLAQKVKTIIFYPLDPKAVQPVLKQAQKQGVPVLAIDSTFGNPKAAAPGITTQVWQGRDIQAYLQAKAMAAANPGGKIGLIGIGFPVPALKYLNKREAFWAKSLGLTVLGTQDNPSDDVTGGEKAANGLLQRYQDMDGVIGYNDPSALGASAAARGAGRKIVIVGLNGSSDGLNAVKAGRIAASVRVDPVGWGSQLVLASYSLITKQNLPLPKVIVRPATLITKANVNSVPSWDAQVKAIR
ncbi:MAG: sugar ABC transporter substrate-binding protein [Gaiellales bacterium]